MSFKKYLILATKIIKNKFLYVFWDTVSLHSSGSPGTH